MDVAGRSKVGTKAKRRRSQQPSRVGDQTGSRNPRVRRSLQLPPRRAIVGGALVALAALGVFVAHRSASAPVSTRYLVASRDVPAGTVLTEGDLGSVALDLPDDMDVIDADRARELVGRVTKTGLSKLELVSGGDVFAEGRFADSDSVEIALDLPGARALAGLISAGSVVDVLATDTEQGRTQVLAAGVRVSSVGESRAAAIGSSGAVRVVLSVDGTETATQVVDASLRSDLTLVLPRPVAEGDR